MHKGHQRPISREDAHANRGQRPRLEEAKQQAGEEIGQRNPVEHAHQPDVGPGIRQAARVKDANDEQKNAAPEHSFERLGSPLLRHGPGE